MFKKFFLSIFILGFAFACAHPHRKIQLTRQEAVLQVNLTPQQLDDGSSTKAVDT